MLGWQLQLRANTTKCLEVSGPRNTGLSLRAPYCIPWAVQVFQLSLTVYALCHLDPSVGRWPINTVIIVGWWCLQQRWHHRSIEWLTGTQTLHRNAQTKTHTNANTHLKKNGVYEPQKRARKLTARMKLTKSRDVWTWLVCTCFLCQWVILLSGMWGVPVTFAYIEWNDFSDMSSKMHFHY